MLIIVELQRVTLDFAMVPRLDPAVVACFFVTTPLAVERLENG